MGRTATALCAVAGALIALILPASAGAAFGPASSFGNGSLSHPQGAVLGGTQIFVADTGNGRVAVFNGAGGFDSALTANGLVPQDVAVAPSGNVYAASPSQVDGWVLGLHLLQWSPPGSSYGIAVDPSGAVWVSDAAGGVIRKYDGAGNFVGVIGGGQLANPQGLTSDGAGSIYVADTGHARIVKFDQGGNVQGVWEMPSYSIVANGQTITGKMDPRDVAVDAVGRVYAPDAGPNSNLVAVFGPDGGLQQIFGAPASDPGNRCAVRTPFGVATSPTGPLGVVSTGENLIRVFDEVSTPCSEPDFGPGGGVTPEPLGGPGNDKKRPKIKILKVPNGCARHNFAFKIQATDDGVIRKLLLFINHKRVAKQKPNKQEWTVKVNMPVRKVQRQLPRGAFLPVLIQVKVVDGTGKKARASKSFRICG